MHNPAVMNFMADLKEKSSADAPALFLLKSTQILYSFLTENGCGLEAPMLVRVDSARGLRVMREFLASFSIPPAVSLGASPKELKSRMAAEEYGVFIVEYERTRLAYANLQLLDRLGNEKEMMVLVLSLETPLGVDERFSGQIYAGNLEDSLKATGEAYANWLVDSVVKNQKAVAFQIKSCVSLRTDPLLFEAAWTAVKTCTELEYGQSTLFAAWEEEIQEALERIREEWEINDEPEDYVEMFCNKLSDMVGGLPPLLNRKRVMGKDYNNVDMAMFYDEMAYYMREPLFREICKSLNARTGVNYVKMQLEKAGLLLCEGKGRWYGTKKMEIIMENSMVKSQRMVKLSRLVFDRNAEFTLVELLEERREEDEQGDKIGEDGENREDSQYFITG